MSRARRDCYTVTLADVRGFRVYELAKLLDVESVVVRARLAELGHPVRSAANFVPAAMVGQLLSETEMLRARGPRAGPPAPIRPSASLYDESGRELATAKEIARGTGVAPSTVRQWVHRGHLKAQGARGREHLYPIADARRLAGADVSSFALPKEFRVIRGLKGSDLDRLVTAEVAARLAGVAASTIRVWVTRGHLRPARTTLRPQMFTVGDVLRAQRRTRRRGGRPRRAPPRQSST